MPRRRLTRAEKMLNKIVREIYEKVHGKQLTQEVDENGNRIEKDITKKALKHRIQASMKLYDLTAKQAGKKVLNTQEFTTAAERSRKNILQAMRKEYHDEFEKLVNLNKEIGRDEHGRFTSLKNNLIWDKELKAYVIIGHRKVGNDWVQVKYMIVTTESPKRMFVEEIWD